MALTLAKALRLLPPPVVGGATHFTNAAFVGAGGKTTALFQLARELRPSVILAASSHMRLSQASIADRHIIVESMAALQTLNLGRVTLLTGRIGADDRTEALSAAALEWLHDYAAGHNLPLLIEADGAREKPLKAPGSHEPPIPGFSQNVVVVAGLAGLGKPLTAKFVHRPEAFAEISGLSAGQTITAESVVRVLNHPLGGRKNVPEAARLVALLNQADQAAQQAEARGMVTPLLDKFEAVLIAALQQGVVHAVHERVAGIVLAAGASARYGRPKQLLDWQGLPFVRAVAKTAIATGLSPVIVVTGARGDEVAAAVEDLPVRVTINIDWASGQASSVRTGVVACPSNVGAAVFLLADQPQVPAGVINALRDAHATGMAPVVAPLVMENRRGNPVLFDRSTFGALRGLEGDQGGRSIFAQFPVEYLPWHDESLLFDVDTEEDYRRLREHRLQ